LQEMPVRIIDDDTLQGYLPLGEKVSADNELLYLAGVGKSAGRLERCLKRGPNVNYKNEMGCTPLMFACGSWSVPYVKRLLAENADPNAEDKNGATAFNVVSDSILTWEAETENEREACRRRRLEMEITGAVLWDRPDVEELEPFNQMDRLYEIKSVLERAGGKPGEKVQRPGYD